MHSPKPVVEIEKPPKDPGLSTSWILHYYEVCCICGHVAVPLYIFTRGSEIKKWKKVPVPTVIVIWVKYRVSHNIVTLNQNRTDWSN